MSAPSRPGWSPDLPERFFGPGNKLLQWKDIRDGRISDETRRRLEPLLEDLRAGEDPLFLPRPREDGSVDWYALAATERGARLLREHLRAFIGPSYSGSSIDRPLMDAADSVERAVMDAAPGRAYRLRVPKVFRDAARERLLLLRSLLKERPPRAAPVPRPMGRVLGDFEQSLRARDGAAAAAHIRELRQLGRLSAQNQLFLEVLRAECLHAWDEILEERRLQTLLTLARPRRVTRALIRALFARELQPFEDSNDPAGAIARFEEKLWPAYPELFRTHRGMEVPEVTRCFMMLAAVARPRRPELRDELLAACPADAPGRPYLEALAALVPAARPPAPVDHLAAAREAFGEGDVGRAFREALAHEGGVERLALLLRCAREIDTLEVAAQALAAVEAASASERETLLGRVMFRTHHDRLLELTTRPPPPAPTAAVPAPPAAIPRDLREWLERLRTQERWDGAVDVIERGVREWDRAGWLADAARVAATARELGAARPPWGEEVLRTSLPHLLSFLLPPERCERALGPVLDQLAVVIEVDEQVRVEQLHALTEVTEARIRIGLTPDGYRSALRVLHEMRERVGAATLGDWALDTLDALTALPAADRTAREMFFYGVADYLRQHARRVSRDQHLLFRQLAKELELTVPGELDRSLEAASPEAAEAGGGLAAALAAKRIALYSLNEPALERVARVLEELAPTARIARFSDKAGGSPALKQQAGTADIFVIATAAAKHAATGFIEANRKAKTTLYAAGQGSASMLRALREFASGARP